MAMKVGDLVTVKSMYTFNKMNTVIGGVTGDNWKLNMGIVTTVFETDDHRHFAEVEWFVWDSEGAGEPEVLMLCNHLEILSEA
tara:strand:+ start:804 stop:1052 length:249 start_codon:yes stop_codon:yes gene_type:complete